MGKWWFNGILMVIYLLVINGQIHYFESAIFNSYVKLPEDIVFVKVEAAKWLKAVVCFEWPKVSSLISVLICLQDASPYQGARPRAQRVTALPGAHLCD